MSTFRRIEVLEVRCWGKLVGAVAQDPTLDLQVFEYSAEWNTKNIQLSPIHMRNRSGTYIFPQLSKSTFYGLPAMLADALPDDFGNAVIDAWLSEEGIDKESISSLDRLAYAGERALGALTFHPAHSGLNGPGTSIALAELVQSARIIVAGAINDSSSYKEALLQLIQVGSSAGGARAKALVQFNPSTEVIRSGYTNAESGFSPWLIKLDGVSKSADGSINSLGVPEQFTRIEYGYYLMACAAGIEMAESRLLLEGSRAHFLTKRFDRDSSGERIHYQSLCALDHLDFRMQDTHAYAQYLNVARKLNLRDDELAQCFRRMVFNIFALNRDDHTKNFGFLLAENSEWKLAPAFDLTYAFNPMGKWTQRHQMSVNGKFENISLTDIYTLGDMYSIPAYKKIVADVGAVISQWRDFALLADVEDHTSEFINRSITNLQPK